MQTARAIAGNMPVHWMDNAGQVQLYTKRKSKPKTQANEENTLAWLKQILKLASTAMNRVSETLTIAVRRLWHSMFGS